MIRHRPYGSGHPYAVSEDQRIPSLPLDGQAVELRARSSAAEVVCEFDGVDLPMEPQFSGEGPVVTDGGHLAAAQAKAARAAVGSWTVTTGPLVFGDRYRYRFREPGRTSRWFEVSAARWVPGKISVSGTDRVVPGSVEWLVDADGPRRVRFAVRLDEGDHLVGFGERFNAVDQRGNDLDAVVFEQYKGQGAANKTYLPMPFAFVIGDSSWGFHVRTSRRTWYSSEGDLLTIEAELGPDGELEIAFYDGEPSAVLTRFLDEVGLPTELPSWVFKLWASGNEWNTQTRVLHEMDRHREHDIPVGALVIEAWSDETTFTAFRGAVYEPSSEPHSLADYTFPPDGPWPDPKGMIDELHARDVKVLLWQIPLQKMRPHPRHQAAVDAAQLVEKGYGVREANGKPYRNRGWWFPLSLMPDLSSQEVRDWWTAKRAYLVAEMGVDGFKTDGGEHAWGHDLRYADGRRGDDGNGLFPVHYARAFGDLLREHGKAPVTFSRAGFTGSQPHGAFWAGDEDSTWTAFESSIRAGITASACGIVYWGWDLAGFSGDLPSAELYLRAAGTSAFMPIMQYHSEFNHHRTPIRDRTPWNIAEQTGDASVIPIFREFAQLRERLVPYLTEQAAVAVRGGKPLMRGLFFDHMERELWSYPLQFKLGDALLVVPVTTPGATDVAAYLPSGEWVDVWTGEVLPGGREVTLPAPIERPPVLCASEHWPRLRGVFQ
ncbi:glycoside hydrolase family 31 protein [Herbidospora mongoliensis]|uniref:glycoside hydrolase family 31 protein n=1 Tax=Herbidospora mongoliensis TaxID=688067 RepID=UPI00082B0AB0|nr:TIM-barrel domain-containing protein [Herbidospora mongoliensis]